MTRTFIGLPWLALALSAIGCSPNEPESSGTNTNWLVACDTSDQCVPTSTCVCGICSRPCASDAECAPGICGSALETAFQCGSSQNQNICLAAAPTRVGNCSSFPVPVVADLAPIATTPCSVPGALVCESFDAPLPAEYGTFHSGPATASVEDCLVHQGAGALRFQSSDFGTWQTRMRLATPVSSGVLAARFYVYVPSQLVIPDYLAMFELWSNDDTSEGKISLEAKPNDVLEVYLTPNGTTYTSAAGALHRDQWSCIALNLNVAAADGSLSLAVDGATLVDEASVITRPTNPLSVAVVEGLPSSDATGLDLLIDDLVVASEPLACP